MYKAKTIFNTKSQKNNRPNTPDGLCSDYNLRRTTKGNEKKDGIYQGKAKKIGKRKEQIQLLDFHHLLIPSFILSCPLINPSRIS